MRKYLKPAMEMEAFDLRDVITASDELPPDPPKDPNEGSAAPVILEIN